MKTKSLIKLICVLIIIAGVSVWSVAGFKIPIISIGNIVQTKPYNVNPWYQLVPLGLDIKGGVVAVYQAQPAEGVEFEKGISQIKTIMESRLAQKGYTEAIVSRQGTDRLRVEIPDISSPEEAIQLVGTPGELEFKDSSNKVWLTGKNLKSAVFKGLSEAKYLVALEFDAEGTKLFADATSANVGKAIDIYLDGEKKSSPTVNTAITDGKAVIESGTEADAKYIASVLASGSMPLKLTELESKTVSATLGDKALNNALLAGAIGIAAVMLFMLLRYRMQGLVADISLIIFILITYWFVADFPWIQLTLPSLAGVILSIGMAVDSNVIIYERIKEEYREGKSLATSVNIGFSKAYTAIIDANITIIIAGVVMMIFGPGPVKNFAITLLAGVLISLLTAVVISKKILYMFMHAGCTSPKLLGLKRGEQNEDSTK